MRQTTDVSRRRMSEHRAARRAKGYRELSIWLHTQVQEGIDEVVRSGKYKSRSEVLAAAAERFLKEQTMT